MEQKLPHEPASLKPRFAGMALLAAAIVLLGLWGVKWYIATDLDRDLQGWREKLNLIAESRTDAVSHYVSNRFTDLQTLADNPSVQLYMGELDQSMGNVTAGEEPAEKSYLRNVLIFTAQRAGFGAAESESAAMGADVKPENKFGLAIVDKDNKPVVSTLWQDEAKSAALAQAARVQPGKQGLLDLHKDKDGTLLMGFVVPVFAIEQPHAADSQIGKIIGVKIADSAFFGLLKHPGVTEKTLEVILVRKQDDKTDYLSPLMDGTGALSRQVESNANSSAEMSLVDHVSSFLSDKKDYRGKAVLATSRIVPGTPWILVTKIDRQEALANGNQRRASMVTFFFLAIAILVLWLMAMWWYANSRRSAMLSSYFKELVHEREEMLSVQRQLVQALIKLVDRRDPFAANHSQLVSRLSGDLAASMGLSENVIDTVRMAANLMNVGKIFVPTELLTKSGKLTDEEKNVIRDSAASAVDLVRGIYFGGPVVETLTQWQERWDGTGPLGLKGDGILISARIIAVANAFIGMISPRAWRTAIAVDAAANFLRKECDTLFDRRIVEALVNYIESADDKSWMKAA